MRPLLGARKNGQRARNTGSGQADICHERIKTMTIVIDSQPHHVPAGMVCVAHTEYGKRSLPCGIAGTPEKRECTAFCVDISGSPIGQKLSVFALEAGSYGSILDHTHIPAVIGLGSASS